MEGAIAVAMGGDASVASNGFWAALNIATTQHLPLLFWIEDNGYGISVPAHLQTPNGNIAANLASYGNLKIFECDGTNPNDAAQTIQEAVHYVREQGAALVRLRVPRVAGAYVRGRPARVQERGTNRVRNLKTIPSFACANLFCKMARLPPSGTIC